ncbi:MAG: hypothetical protein ACTTHL_08225 [Oribacterium sp.]
MKRATAEQNHFKKMLISWIIILLMYLLIGIIFITFGFLNATISGVCLSVIPYLACAVYLIMSPERYSGIFYISALIIPCCIEKVLLKGLKAMHTEGKLALLLNQYLSFYNGVYIMASVGISILLVIIVITAKKKKF